MSERYPEAFEGDGFIEAEVRQLCGKWRVKTIVETGTNLGWSTEALADMGAEVVTIEVDVERFVTAGGRLEGVRNVMRVPGDSGQVLSGLLPFLKWPVLFYLDAHWGTHSPLLDELGAIGESGVRPVIVIHDFFNPEHPEYGFDTWDIGPYRLELILPALEKIYGVGGYRHRYNGEAAGLRRGVIYIEPGGGQ